MRKKINAKRPMKQYELFQQGKKARLTKHDKEVIGREFLFILKVLPEKNAEILELQKACEPNDKIDRQSWNKLMLLRKEAVQKIERGEYQQKIEGKIEEDGKKIKLSKKRGKSIENEFNFLLKALPEKGNEITRLAIYFGHFYAVGGRIEFVGRAAKYMDKKSWKHLLDLRKEAMEKIAKKK